jgi:hypothetical protein
MEKTAVEWLIEKHFGSIENCSPNFRNHIEQAKEMEKEQMESAYLAGESKDKQYYNETFKTKKK